MGLGTPLEPEGSELEAFFWNSSDLMVVVDERLQLVRFNPAFAKAAGFKLGTSILEFVLPGDRERVRGVLGECLKGAPRNFTCAMGAGPGPRRVGEWAVCAEPSVQRLFVVIRDVTARDRLERELAQAHKLEAVGSLASGIAHEINTPIQFVGDNLVFISESLTKVFMLLGALKEHEPSKPLLAQFGDIDLPFLADELPLAAEQACEGVQRVAELVGGMKEFAHQDAGQIVPTDINRALERTITIARNEWKYAADLETEFQPLPDVPCIASAIRQVFLNLICNAAHANLERNTTTGRARGLIKVSTRCEGDMVVISVSDAGTGIDDAVRRRLFEPFFTTKPAGQGTGQGLAISRSIVCEKHGGQLDFETEVGVGTTFHVRLPLKASQLAAA